jgi:type II secretory ATPase GspE/PulE/Tfp pilus assembly ATPase PilB-like protein/GAF domain-containing protein
MAPSNDDAAHQLEQRRRLQALGNFITGAPTLEELLPGAQAQIPEVFRCERTTIFALDTKESVLYSLAKTGGEFREIRVAIDPSSIAGFVAAAKHPVNLPNVYEAADLRRIHPQLQFDDRWDKASGFVTRQMLCVPVLYEGNLLGVLQIINRQDRTPFSPRDAANADEVARALGTAFFNLNRMRALAQERKPTKWDGLIDSGAISEDALQRMLGEAQAQKIDPARFLLERGGVSRATLERSLSVFYNCEPFRFTGNETIPEDLRKKVRVDYLKQICAAPVEKRPGVLVVAIDDPADLQRADALRALEHGLRVDLQVGLRDEISAFIEHSYGLREDVGKILRQLSSEDKPEVSAAESDATEERVAESDSAVIKLANQIIADAYKRGVSDIHIEPYGKDAPTIIRFRLDGDCQTYQEIPAAYRSALVARFKIMANLDISERRKPQDGKIRLKLSKDQQLELRVATIPTANGNEDVVMRILAASKPMPIDRMGLSERNLRELRSLVSKPYGLMLVVGPTGSGKTTTLHSALGSINTTDMKIWTAEDPVEITQAGLRQVQVQPKIGFTFEAAMRAFLRADPDVIMVGEMRDRETAETGIEASLTGHLVFSTLHTNSAPETITRLLDMELDPFSFADSLLGVLAQRLARSICKTCKQPYAASREEYEEIAAPFGGAAELERQGIPYSADFHLWRGAGCETCGGTGYKGRVGLHELLVSNDDLKRAIAHKAPVEEIRNLAMQAGMTTLLQDGIQKALQGLTDLKSVVAVCSR